MENKEIARVLAETADLMEIAAEDSFRIRSYRNGASAVESNPDRIEDILRDPARKVTDIPGIGKAVSYTHLQGQYSQAAERLELSRDYPERLGTGAPPDPDFRIQDYLLMYCSRESGAAPKAAEAAQRIDAYASRHSRTNLDSQKKQVDEWYRTTFRTGTELNALRELSRLCLLYTSRCV